MFHYSERAKSLTEEAGARVLHLTTYSPDFNPDRGIHFKDQGAVTSGEGADPRKLLNVLVKAIKKVTADDICGRIVDCGYTFSLN
jgi:hypothetical protein